MVSDPNFDHHSNYDLSNSIASDSNHPKFVNPDNFASKPKLNSKKPYTQVDSTRRSIVNFFQSLLIIGSSATLLNPKYTPAADFILPECSDSVTILRGNVFIY
jgi:hypothetical protein